MRPVTTAIAERVRQQSSGLSLFVRLGGHGAVARIVARFRQRLFDDDELATQLMPLGPSNLDAGMTAFLTRALGGPSPDPATAAGVAAPVDPLSVWLDVDPFTRVVAHLWMALLDLEIDVDLKDEVVVAILLEAMAPPH